MNIQSASNSRQWWEIPYLIISLYILFPTASSGKSGGCQHPPRVRWMHPVSLGSTRLHLSHWGLGRGHFFWQNSSLSFEPKLWAEEQCSHSPAPRVHTAEQHLPIHSALLAHAATWHATVPRLEAVYTGIGAVFLVKMIIFFLHKISWLFKGNLAHFKLLMHKSMRSMLQLVWAVEALCDTCAESDLKTRIKAQLGRDWNIQEGKVTLVHLR